MIRPPRRCPAAARYALHGHAVGGMVAIVLDVPFGRFVVPGAGAGVLSGVAVLVMLVSFSITALFH
ncbi:MAG: hypothetical protein PVF77_15770 [Anaerolineae bacterium]